MMAPVQDALSARPRLIGIVLARAHIGRSTARLPASLPVMPPALPQAGPREAHCAHWALFQWTKHEDHVCSIYDTKCQKKKKTKSRPRLRARRFVIRLLSVHSGRKMRLANKAPKAGLNYLRTLAPSWTEAKQATARARAARKEAKNKYTIKISIYIYIYI